MQEYVIDVTVIEELQTLKYKHDLENIFNKARSTIVNGEKVVLMRKGKSGPDQKFDELTTLEELELYKGSVLNTSEYTESF